MAMGELCARDDSALETPINAHHLTLTSSSDETSPIIHLNN